MQTIYRSDPEYPRRLLELSSPPDEITISGPLEHATVVAIVGRRDPRDEAIDFAKKLAAAVVDAGGIVASGGAVGIDTAAHRGSMQAGGRTWAIAPSGSDFNVPVESTALYKEVAKSPGCAVVWPFPKAKRERFGPYFTRNGVLAALADAVVIVQAGVPSGALNTAKWARQLDRPLWVVPAPPWEPWDEQFKGSLGELARGTRPLTSIESFLETLRLRPRPSHTPRAPARRGTEAENRVLQALSSAPKHRDEVAAAVGLDAPTVSTALLTLALEDVVVEGPGGFFRLGSRNVAKPF